MGRIGAGHFFVRFAVFGGIVVFWVLNTAK
jgi:hypothetical protein